MNSAMNHVWFEGVCISAAVLDEIQAVSIAVSMSKALCRDWLLKYLAVVGLIAVSTDREEQTIRPQPVSGRPRVTIYTDGAAEPNPGPGGFGVVLLHPKKRLELSGGFQKTTNNRMELMGVIVGLEKLTKPCHVSIHSDSKYVVDSISKGWIRKWQKKNWVRGDKPVPNADLWQRYLRAAAAHEVKIHWLKGHAGHEHNERCDELAVAAAKGTDLAIDEGYVPKAPTVASDQSNIASTDKAIGVSRPSRKAKVTHKEPGEPCRDCGTPLEKRPPAKSKRKPSQTYYFAWRLVCPGCKKSYMVEEAKVFIEAKQKAMFDGDESDDT